jgi:hypothetical protein
MPLDRQLRTLVKDRVDRSKIGKRSEAARAMMLVTFIAVAVSIVWWAALGGATRGQLYSPGHVSKAHANFENDCAKCHAGDGNGGFRKQVTDTACLTCHDGAMHHPNQLIADTQADVSRPKLTMAVAEAWRAPVSAGRSADCTSCHVEHRGEDLLAGRDDSHCTVCHADLSKATQAGLTMIQTSVTKFDLKNHPPFGRRLVRPDPVLSQDRLTDPTKLKFNHRKHLTEVEGLKGDQSCIKCHASSVDAPALMQPVSYERNCKSCHALEVPGSITEWGEDKEPITPELKDWTIPHKSVGEVRAFLADRLSKTLDKPDTAFSLVDNNHKLDPRGIWTLINLRGYADNARMKYEDNNELADIAGGKPGETPIELSKANDPLMLRASLVDAMTVNLVYTAKGQCVKCHDLTAEKPENLGDPIAVESKPTGMTATPRHWFRAAKFDHRAHRDMSCVSCHSTLSETNLAGHEEGDADVEQTSFVHSPGMVWADYTKLQAGGAASTRSCVDCHHADTFGQRGAGASCVTCHNFHDRALEQRPVPSPTTAPSAPFAAAP